MGKNNTGLFYIGEEVYSHILKEEEKPEGMQKKSVIRV